MASLTVDQQHKTHSAEYVDRGSEYLSKRRRYYMPSEVASHNCESDCWVSVFNKVIDVTPLIQEYDDELVKPLLQAAGQDVSHWFDSSTLNVRTHIDPTTGIELPYTPVGRFVHVPPCDPRSDWANDFGLPWWRNPKYCVGNLSRSTRKIRVINTLTSQENVMDVCSEETLAEILDRYLEFNQHAGSYSWKSNGVPLDMDKTLEQNGIPDLTEEYVRLSLGEDHYIPAIHLYFEDDLTIA